MFLSLSLHQTVVKIKKNVMKGETARTTSGVQPPLSLSLNPGPCDLLGFSCCPRDSPQSKKEKIFLLPSFFFGNVIPYLV